MAIGVGRFDGRRGHDVVGGFTRFANTADAARRARPPSRRIARPFMPPCIFVVVVMTLKIDAIGIILLIKLDSRGYAAALKLYHTPVAMC